MSFDPDLAPDDPDILLRFVNSLKPEPTSTRICDAIADEYVVMKDHRQPFGFRVWGKFQFDWVADCSPLPVIRKLMGF